jgi:hypothetical protein
VVSLHAYHVFLKDIDVLIDSACLPQVLELFHRFMLPRYWKSLTKQLTKLCPIEKIQVQVTA